jgi:cell division protein FtsI (penicillin-binding protein 3)
MRSTSRKTRKDITPRKVPAAMLVFIILAVMALFTKGCFSNDQADPRAAAPAADNRKPIGAAAGRGKVLDRNYRELAVSFTLKSLYAHPLEIIDLVGTATLLAADLGLEEKQLAGELKGERGFVWLGRRLPGSRADVILDRRLPGIYAVAEGQRFYPAGRDGAHVVGFLEENNGLAGVEFSYDHLLRGGARLAAGANENEGGDLQLTLDLRAQKLLAGGLNDLLRETAAPAGTAILMNMQTGAILAMASLPDYDPNVYWDVGSAGRHNRAVNGRVDAGGFQALFAHAAGHEGARVAGADPLAALKRELRQDGAPPRNRAGKWFATHGDRLLSAELMALTAAAGEGAEPTGLAESLGLYRNTGIDLPESDDLVPRQADETTPLGLLAAVAVLLNGGRGITPHLGDALIEARTGRRTMMEWPARPGLLKPLTSKKTSEALAAGSRPGAEALFLESLRPVAPTGAATAGGGKPRDGEDQARFQTVMIACRAQPQSDFVLLVALEQAVVDHQKKTPMRNMGEALLERMTRLAAEKIKPPSPAAMAAREKLLYADWLDSQILTKPEIAAATGQAKLEVMPALMGLSLRKALRSLQPFGLRVKVVGSGRVVAQEPQSGLRISAPECLLTLRADG